MTMLISFVALLQVATAVPDVHVSKPDLSRQTPVTLEGSSLLETLPDEPSTTRDAASPERAPFKTVQRFIIRRLAGTNGDVFIVDVQGVSVRPEIDSVLIIEQMKSGEDKMVIAPKR